MAVIRINHHDFPEALREQIERRLGAATVAFREVSHQIVEVEFDEREAPWRYYGSIGRAIHDLQEENEWIISAEHVG